MRIPAMILFILLAQPTLAQTITVTSGSTWVLSSPSKTITKAGKNYEHFEETASNHSLLKINSLVLWSVSVQLTNASNWDPALQLSVRRTGDGTGAVTIAGGNTYIALTNASQPFFSGLLSLGFGRENIPVQYRIDGLSVMLPVKNYTATVLYTITGL